MFKITKNGVLVGFTELEPILNEGESSEEVDRSEYEQRLEQTTPKEPQFITIEIPLSLLASNQELQQRLVFLRLVYSHMETITRNGITYLSHIDITDIQGYLPTPEYKKWKSLGIKFPPEVEALYAKSEK